MLAKPERSLVDALLSSARIDLPTAVPAAFERNRMRAREIITAVEDIYGGAANTPYFQTSLLRYEHYLAIAQNLVPGASVLEIGSAPGHVSVGLSLLGFEEVPES